MRNIKLSIEYDGTDYQGWQIQKSKIPATKIGGSAKNFGGKNPACPAGRQKLKIKTIQETIEGVLKKILQEKVRIIAQGRTDAGVHAQGQVANFKTDSTIPLKKLQRALNGLLPEDIVIKKIEEVSPKFHSRFDVKSKLYRYTILNRAYPTALLKNRVYFCPYPLDVDLMRQEARGLLGRHDFKAFQASDKKERDSVRRIKRIKIIKEKDLIHIDMEADGFLYNMARNIVGTLVEIGRGKFPPGSLKKILLSRNRRRAGPTAPACGLCLVRVKC